MSVDYARGAPRYRPDAGAMRLLGTREIDLALIIGAPRQLPPPVQEALQSTRRIAVGPRVSESPMASSDVAIDTGVPGIHENGMALRMDDLPLPLRQVVTGPLSALDVIQAIERRLRSPARGGA
jgi:formylmethanofuran dehydrogenase subunit B